MLQENGGTCPRKLVWIQPPFLAYKTQLTENQSTPFEITLNSGLETSLEFYITLYLHMISAFEGHGNAYEPVRSNACHAYKQAVT
jgi:hypothetical protein